MGKDHYIFSIISQIGIVLIGSKVEKNLIGGVQVGDEKLEEKNYE